MSDLAIDVTGLTKIFDDKTVVDNLSLKVKKGSIFGFLGSNGSGKTTTIRMICGLLNVSQGEGRCIGYDIRTQQAEIKEYIGYMPQKFSLYGGLTVYENLLFFAKIYQIPNPKQAIKDILEDLELGPYQGMKTSTLSGGWKQRIMLGCALIHKPKMLFLDEPTAGVDPKARKSFWDYLHKISRRDGTTILVTTHYMDEAEKCTDLAYINLGVLLYSGITKDIIPFSKIKTVVLLDADTEMQNQLNTILIDDYPELLTTIVNNDLRISSKNLDLLNELKMKESAFHFKEVTPSFEEVFIGLMN
jgi:ABC-2 type transport system ATP-binding protein